MAELTLRVITPERIVLDERVSSVRIPGVDGSIGIHPRHAHMVAALDVGPLEYAQGGTEHALFVSEGFAEVRDGTVRVVCEAGERPDEIDESRAAKAEERARARLKEAGVVSSKEAIDRLRAEAALRRAVLRLKVYRYGDRTRP